MILAATLTGEPFLDFIMQSGVVGVALFFMYRLMMKTLDKKGGNTQMMLHAAKAFEAIEQRLTSHDTLLKHIMDTQSHQYETQLQTLKLMERQMTLLEQFGQYIHGSDDKLDALRTEMAAVRAAVEKKPRRSTG